MTEPREEVQWFASYMERKLAEHDDDRTGWANCDQSWLFQRIIIEAGELAKRMNESIVGFTSAEKVILECADIANFAMMIADNVRKEHNAFAELWRKAGEKR